MLIWIRPIDIGIGLTALIETILLLTVIYFISYNGEILAKLSSYMSEGALKNAWIDSK